MFKTKDIICSVGGGCRIEYHKHLLIGTHGTKIWGEGALKIHILNRTYDWRPELAEGGKDIMTRMLEKLNSVTSDHRQSNLRLTTYFVGIKSYPLRCGHEPQHANSNSSTVDATYISECARIQVASKKFIMEIKLFQGRPGKDYDELCCNWINFRSFGARVYLEIANHVKESSLLRCNALWLLLRTDVWGNVAHPSN
jgi:hypothetical protein